MDDNREKSFNLYSDGFCFLPKVFSEDQISSAREALWDIINCRYQTGFEPENRFWNPGDDPNSIIKIDKPHLCNRSIWDLVSDKNFGELLGRATNAKTVQVWHSQVVWKPASKNEKGNAGWHRDSQYWPFWSKDGLFTAWIALTNVSNDSGPVRFIRGSNQWDDIEGMDFFNQNIKSQNKILKKVHGVQEIVNALLTPGEISIHTSQTYHSSIGNKEKSPRVGMVVHFCTDKAKRITIQGENSDYLDQITDHFIAPIIYKD